MKNSKEVKYQVHDEILGSPSLFVDEISGSFDVEKAIGFLSEYTGIEKEKIIYFVENFGLKRIMNDTDILGLTNEQKEKIYELKYLIEKGE